MSEIRSLKCAVYTRKSTEEGLEQSYNSLEAQRDAGEAYIRSQAHEGWSLIPDAFDDGGFTGANIERPALQRLMSLVRRRAVDIIVVYKIDRLTRSLGDFARLAEVFEQYGVSFVSVTQQFNTTSSMGRLMLNVLLSFAQFEREITGERIRDKIAASKRKGMWTGGFPPLGYDVVNNALVVNEGHAAIVRRVFETYLRTGAVSHLADSLKSDDVISPVRIVGTGKQFGGTPFTRGQLYRLLSNPIYAGRIGHKGEVHEGLHRAIITDELWNSVLSQLAQNTQGTRSNAPRQRQSPLSGRMFTASGDRVKAAAARKGTRRYRYLVWTEDDEVRRIRAHLIEEAVRSMIVSDFTSPEGRAAHLVNFPDRDSHRIIDLLETTAARLTSSDGVKLACDMVTRLEVHPDRLALQLQLNVSNGQPLDLSISHPFRYGRPSSPVVLRHPSASARSELLQAIARARAWSTRLLSGEVESVTDLGRSEDLTKRVPARLLHLALLSPTVVKALMEGRYPELSISELVKLVQRTPNWVDQERLISSL